MKNAPFKNHTNQRRPKVLVWSKELKKKNRGSYMIAHVLLNLLNEFGKEIKREACRKTEIILDK